MFPQKKFEKLLTVVAIEVRSLSVFVSVFLNDKTFILGLELKIYLSSKVVPISSLETDNLGDVS